MNDRRHEPRVRALNLVHVEEYSVPSLDDYPTDAAIGKTLDLSHDGMRLELDHCLLPRTKVKLDLAMGEQILTLTGFVRSITVVDEKLCDHGIEFVDVTPEQYEDLEAFLQLRSE